jgi:hypothetical protein
MSPQSEARSGEDPTGLQVGGASVLNTGQRLTPACRQGTAVPVSAGTKSVEQKLEIKSKESEGSKLKEDARRHDRPHEAWGGGRPHAWRVQYNCTGAVGSSCSCMEPAPHFPFLYYALQYNLPQFCALSIVLSLIYNTTFRRLNSVLVFMWNLLN